MSRYQIKAIRAAASLDLLTLDEARAAVIHLATLLEQTQEAASYAYGTALVEARSTSTLVDHERWRALRDHLRQLLTEQEQAAEELASPEIIERVRGARRDHDPTAIARADQITPDTSGR